MDDGHRLMIVLWALVGFIPLVGVGEAYWVVVLFAVGLTLMKVEEVWMTFSKLVWTAAIRLLLSPNPFPDEKSK